MIKQYLSLLILAILPVILPAQEKEQKQPEKKIRRMFLDISSGVSLPIGKAYPSIDTISSRSGYSSTGYFIQADFAYLGKSDWGIAVQYTFQHNPLKSGSSTVVPDGTRYPLGTKGWSDNFLMVGPAYLHSFNKVVLDVQALIGVVLSFSPVFNDTDPVDSSNHSNTAAGLGLGIRTAVGYSISRKVTLMLNLNWLGGFPTIDKKYEPQIVGYDPVEGRYIYSNMTEVRIKKTISAFNIGAGVIYRF